jgi:[methyl-Co(III) methanol-specific corrinoid protein]:coenzyme M methyltransferase
VESPSDFLERQPIKAVLECIEILRHRYGDRVAIIGKVMGPWTMGYHMKGVQEFLINVLLDPDQVRAFLEKLLPISIIFGKAQIQAGADVLMVADHTTGDLVRAETYRDFLLPIHKILNQELQCPTILHCCGRTLDRMQYFAEAGFDCYHFESANDAKKAVEAVGGKISLAGNINDPETLLQGTPDQVRLQVLYAMDAGVNIIGPECAIPAITPNRNMLAIYDAAEEWYRVRVLEGRKDPFPGLEDGKPPFVPTTASQMQRNPTQAVGATRPQDE